MRKIKDERKILKDKIFWKVFLVNLAMAVVFLSGCWVFR